jgi:NTE family protein
MKPKAVEKIGLVLTGGGARSAYHAGALLGLADLLSERGLPPMQFPIICGISGGAINGGYLASRLTELPAAYSDLVASWSEITLEDVIDVTGIKMVSTAVRLTVQLGFGGLLNENPVTQLMDTAPLVCFLKSRIDFDSIRRNISEGHLHALGLTATNYGTGSTVTFYDGDSSITPWARSQRIGIRSKLFLKHVLASAAIPILFPPVRLSGSFYGDGAIRMPSPLSPAIHFGADRIIAIGVRYHRSPIETLEMNRTLRMKEVQLADISGILLNSLFLDALDSDLERMIRINHTLARLDKAGDGGDSDGLRRIPVLAIRPSKDIGELALDEFRRFSPFLRHFLRGLGASEFHGSDLLSYVAFEKSYTTRLIELGIADVKADASRIICWLEES